MVAFSCAFLVPATDRDDKRTSPAVKPARALHENGFLLAALKNHRRQEASAERQFERSSWHQPMAAAANT